MGNLTRDDFLLETYFAPPERASDQDIERQRRLFQQAPLLKDALDSVQEMVLILNRERQIVFANRRFLEFLGITDLGGICGLRPGEAVNCIQAYSAESPSGCGTSKFCRTCGAVNAILNCRQGGEADVQECSIIRRDTLDALNLRVRVSPLTMEGESFSSFAVEDISGEKRRQELERTFFHDLNNIANAISGLTKVLELAPPEQQGDVCQYLSAATAQFIETINSHKVVFSAERDELVRIDVEIDTLDFLRETISFMRGHSIAENRAIAFGDNAVGGMLKTDRGLLSRIIVNMLKNALEATPEGGTVTVGCDREEESVRFWVHNSEVMAADVASQVFRRSFSTKGIGRGQGTYSMRLLGERYLGGTVSFSSTEGEGTIFSAAFPTTLKGRGTA